MAPLRTRDYAFLLCLSVCALFLGACGTTPTARRTTALPKYEPPLAKRDFQNVRTTAYTHTESDHLQYGNRNALGGRLRAARGAVRRAEYTPRAIPVASDDPGFHHASYSGAGLEKFSLKPTTTTKIVKTKGGKRSASPSPPSRKLAVPRRTGHAGRREQPFALFPPGRFIGLMITAGLWPGGTRSTFICLLAAR